MSQAGLSQSLCGTACAPYGDEEITRTNLVARFFGATKTLVSLPRSVQHPPPLTLVGNLEKTLSACLSCKAYESQTTPYIRRRTAQLLRGHNDCHLLVVLEKVKGKGGAMIARNDATGCHLAVKGRDSLKLKYKFVSAIRTDSVCDKLRPSVLESKTIETISSGFKRKKKSSILKRSFTASLCFLQECRF